MFNIQSERFMRNITIISKAGFFLACITGFVFILSACSSDSDPAPAPINPTTPTTVAVSGKINSEANPEPGPGEPDVMVKGFYSETDPTNPSTTTAADGTFTLNVDSTKAVSIQLSKAGFSTLNFPKETVTANVTDADEYLPTVTEAQQVIDLALGASTTLLANKAWFVVDVKDMNDNEVNGVSISANPAPDVEVYTKCDGTDSLGNVTTGAPCPGDRPVMYLAYYDAAPGEVTVTVGADTETVPVRMGQISIADFEQ